MIASRLCLAAVAAALMLGVTPAAAQHAPAATVPEPAPAKTAAPPPAKVEPAKPETKPEAKPETKPETKPEAKPVEPVRQPATAGPGPLATAAAIDLIMRKLDEDLAKTPRPPARSGHNSAAGRQPARPRLQLAWRLSVIWPAELTSAKP